jgi:hypothetical protein
MFNRPSATNITSTNSAFAANAEEYAGLISHWKQTGDDLHEFTLSAEAVLSSPQTPIHSDRLVAQ